MKALIATPGRFHTFALARELYARDALLRIVSGFPWRAVKRERLPRSHVETEPLYQIARSALSIAGFLDDRALQWLGCRASAAVDLRALQGVDAADVLIALSGCGTASGTAMRERGKPFICDRGSSHILHQQRLLSEEADLNSVKLPYFSSAIVERELQEYEIASLITVPSSFAQRSFIGAGFAKQKVVKIAYGADLANFYQTAEPSDATFEVLFVGALSLRKGIRYLIESFRRLGCKNKRLTLVGARTYETRTFEALLSQDNIRALGPVPNDQLKELMSRSHVMVLPSIEEGLALVIGESLACGCPVIATVNSGAEDLFDDGKEGFIVPIRDPRAIEERLEFLIDHPHERKAMSSAGIARMRSLHGWNQYGEAYFRLIDGLARCGNPSLVNLEQAKLVQ